MNQAQIFAAIEFAAKAHAGQYRKGTRIPYLFHPLGVARILIEENCSEELIITGLLHDTIEDTAVTGEQIAEKFGAAVAGMVQMLTDSPHLDHWPDRKNHTLQTLSKAPAAVLMVAFADKLDNIRSIGQDYPAAGEKFWERFSVPKEQMAWYYRSLADVFSNRPEFFFNKKLIREFIETVIQVFGEDPFVKVE